MKSLVCITTCNRLPEVKKYIWDYIRFCNNTQGFDFLLALDGFEQEYLDFASEFKIPLLYSENREGVGISKNRVLKQFPDYDYYFFIEDDVELVEQQIFDYHIEVSERFNIPHLITTGPREIIRVQKEEKFTLVFAKYGGAVFNFFTNEGLKIVGGWHPYFAKFRRFGHTEHSYRFFHTGSMEAPFVVINEARKMILTHIPPHVSGLKGVEINPETHLAKVEEKLINQKLKHYPITTISPFFFNGESLGHNSTVTDFLTGNKKKYPLTKGKYRRISISDHYFQRSKIQKNLLKKLFYLSMSFVNNPLSLHFRHLIKKTICK